MANVAAASRHTLLGSGAARLRQIPETTAGEVPDTFQAQAQQPYVPPQPPNPELAALRDQTRAEIERGFYDVRLIEIEVEEQPAIPMGMMGGGDGAGLGAGGGDMSEMLSGLMPKKRSKKRVTVADARRIFAQEEEAKLIDMDAVKREALADDALWQLA